MSPPAVLLVVFNRPRPTAEVLDRILAADVSRVLVVGDGPRGPADEAAVDEVRAVVRQRTDPRIVPDFSDQNLGLRRNVTRGIDRLMAEFGQGIVLEDDMRPARALFPFLAELLGRYRDDDRVGAIAGQRLAPLPVGGRPLQLTDWVAPYDYGFSHIMPPWGWATWARAWERAYPKDLGVWRELRASGRLERLLGLAAAREWTAIFDHLEQVDSWWLRWTLGQWLHHQLTAVPRVNLLENVGIGDARGTLTGLGTFHARFRSLPAEERSGPLVHPPHLGVRSAEAEQAFADWVMPTSGVRRVLKRAVFDGPIPAARALTALLGLRRLG